MFSGNLFFILLFYEENKIIPVSIIMTKVIAFPVLNPNKPAAHIPISNPKPGSVSNPHKNRQKPRKYGKLEATITHPTGEGSFR